MKKSDLVILCDLGGVLIDLDWISSAKKIFARNLTIDEMKSKWLSLQSVKVFEGGNCSFEDFHLHFCRENSFEISLEDFTHQFNSIIGPPKTNCREILLELKKYGCLAMLSNTNQIHINKLKLETNILELFDHIFLSYEMHLVKPSAEIFSAVCEELNVAPEKVLFFDDSPDNVLAAKSCGLNSFKVTSPSQILEIVKSEILHARQ